MNRITRKKLSEVALPLEAINKAPAREKSIRQGHPPTLHLRWARRPLAAGGGAAVTHGEETLLAGRRAGYHGLSIAMEFPRTSLDEGFP